MARSRPEKVRICCSSCWLVTGVLLFVFGLTVLLLLPQIIDNVVHKSIPLSRNGFATELWMNPPYDALLEFWFYNLTNPEAFFAGREKARVNEMGPYPFNEIQKKEARWLVNNQIEYLNRKWYYAIPDSKRGLDWLDDKITVPNVPLLTVYSQLEWTTLPWWLKVFLDELLSIVDRQDMYVTKTVRELLFDGYDDPLISFQHRLNPATPAKMGFFYGKNGSDDLRYVIDDGTDDYRKTGTIRSWNNTDRVHFWVEGTSANGTDGTIYTPGISKTDVLRIFVSDLCRSLYITYQGVDVVVKEIAGYRFYAPAEVFDALREENWGFCQHTTDKYYPEMPVLEYDNVTQMCLPSGLLNVSKCQFGAPIVFSSPHFKFTDKDVQESVDGMTPPSDDDITVVDLEPMTGAGLHFERKIQINVGIAHTNYSKARNLKASILPLLYLNESATVDEVTAASLYEQIVVLPRTAQIVMYVLIALGALLFVSMTALLLFTLCARGQQELLLDDVTNAEDTDGEETRTHDA